MQVLIQHFSRQYLLILSLHLIFLLIVFSVVKVSGVIKSPLSEKDFLHFDASWYNDVKDNGYVFKEDAQSNSGFYPAFPYVWKITHLTPVGISIFNAVIFFISFFLLAKAFDFSVRESLLMLSVPSLMFNLIPYSEAAFFLSSTILLIGLYKKSDIMLYAGLFFCCFIRPVTVIFIPALLFTEFISEKNNRQRIHRFIYGLLACTIPFLLVAVIQWSETNVWFAHSKSQILHWDHGFHVPKFPLTTWVGPKTIWLDGTAFWMGLLAVGFCISLFFGKRKDTMQDKSLLFSLAYLSGVAMFTLFFNGYNDRGSTTLLSLNRYFFAAPFFFIVLQKCMRLPQLSSKNYFYLIASVVFVWLLFGAYTEIDWFNRIKTIIYFFLLTIAIITYTFSINHEWFLKKNFWILLYIVGCSLQAYLFFRFLSGEWVG